MQTSGRDSFEVVVKHTETGVLIKIGNADAKELDMDAAREFASIIRGAVVGINHSTINTASDYAIIKEGTKLRIHVPSSGPEYWWFSEVDALGVAQLIENVTNESC